MRQRRKERRECGSGCHEQATRLFAAAAVNPRVTVQASHRQTRLMLVRSGVGITLVSGSLSSMEVSGLTFRPLQTDSKGIVISAAFREGDIPGVVAQFLRAANDTVAAVDGYWGHRDLQVKGCGCRCATVIVGLGISAVFGGLAWERQKEE